MPQRAPREAGRLEKRQDLMSEGSVYVEGTRSGDKQRGVLIMEECRLEGGFIFHQAQDAAEEGAEPK